MVWSPGRACREKRIREDRRRALISAGVANCHTTGDEDLDRNSTNLYVSNIHRSVNEQVRFRCITCQYLAAFRVTLALGCDVGCDACLSLRNKQHCGTDVRLQPCECCEHPGHVLDAVLQSVRAQVTRVCHISCALHILRSTNSLFFCHAASYSV
jgi:hypothetical protein